MKNPRRISKVLPSIWPAKSKLVFQTARFLQDYPCFRPIFENLAMSAEVPVFVPSCTVSRTLCARFNVGFSIHAPGQMMQDLAIQFPHLEFSESDLAGYMFRSEVRNPDFHIAVKNFDNRSNLDRGTVLHEFGHYIEQRVAAHRHQSLDPYAMRETAFRSAYDVVRAAGGPCAVESDLCQDADELTAWINAILLCLLLKIDPAIVVVGMALDVIAHPKNDASFYILDAVAKVACGQTNAGQMFESVGPFSLINGLRPDSLRRDIQLCEQIDRVSSLLLKSIHDSLLRHMPIRWYE